MTISYANITATKNNNANDNKSTMKINHFCLCTIRQKKYLQILPFFYLSIQIWWYIYNWRIEVHKFWWSPRNRWSTSDILVSGSIIFILKKEVSIIVVFFGVVFLSSVPFFWIWIFRCDQNAKFNSYYSFLLLCD